MTGLADRLQREQASEQALGNRVRIPRSERSVGRSAGVEGAGVAWSVHLDSLESRVEEKSKLWEETKPLRASDLGAGTSKRRASEEQLSLQPHLD